MAINKIIITPEPQAKSRGLMVTLLSQCISAVSFIYYVYNLLLQHYITLDNN